MSTDKRLHPEAAFSVEEKKASSATEAPDAATHRGSGVVRWKKLFHSRFKRLSRLFIGLKKGKIPFTAVKENWAIGIYEGSSPFSFSPASSVRNPVLTARDVTDMPAQFVADPFMIRDGATWYMFFEVLNKLTSRADIGLATSEDGYNWRYRQIVLKEPFHLSYPYVFRWQDTFYMIPETFQAGAVRLYKAVHFPTEWRLAATLLEGGDFADASPFYFKEMWWMFVSSSKSNILRLFFATELTGSWVEHPQSPVIAGDLHTARPGGRVVVEESRVIRYAQDDYPKYGNKLRAFEVTELTTTSYQERASVENPVLEASGNGWNKEGMHHLDPHQIEDGKWIGCVDGIARYRVFGLQY